MNIPTSDRRLLYIAVGVLSIPVVSAVCSHLFRPFSNPHQVIPSPLQTRIPHLSATDRKTLPYPSESYLPGARDVDSPYGTFRVYEFGPSTTDRRVVFLHGISTPCISLSEIAHHLASKGCRVMLIDLFGRGFSSSPSDLDHDNRLYAAQVFMAVTSSPVSWIGDGRRFTMVGYSLGGGLAADFTSWFPHLVDDLVLIAPGGLQHLGNISWRSKILYSTGLLPEGLLRWLVKRRLKKDYPSRPSPGTSENNEVTAAEKVIISEIPDSNGSGLPEVGQLRSDGAPWKVDVDGTIAWQLDHNEGFVHAFMSSFKHCPIYSQHERWQIIGQQLDSKKLSKDPVETSNSLRSNAVLLVLGEKDEIVTVDETKTDAQRVLGPGNLETVVIEGAGHDVPIPSAGVVAERIWEFWTSSAPTKVESAAMVEPPDMGNDKESDITNKEETQTQESPKDAAVDSAKTESARVKDLKQKLKNEKEARKLELGDLHREAQLKQMQTDEIKAENERLRAMLSLKREEILKHLDVTAAAQERQRLAEGGDDVPPERSCPAL